MGCTQAVGGTGAGVLPSEDILVGAKLGQGSVGQVRLAQWRASSDAMAVKVVPLPGYRGEASTCSKLPGAAQDDERLWRKVGRHLNCVELLGAFVLGEVRFMAMERCECSLADRLGDVQAMGEMGVAHVLRGALSGVAHLHQRRIVHRALRPSKILFGGPAGDTVKICGFAWAAQLPAKGGLRLQGAYGSVDYMSPEMVGNRGYSRGTDVWSLGVVAYVLLYGRLPYRPLGAGDATARLAIICGAPAPAYVGTVSGGHAAGAVAVSFVQALLERTPRERITAALALPHAFLAAHPLLKVEIVRSSASLSSWGCSPCSSASPASSFWLHPH